MQNKQKKRMRGPGLALCLATALLACSVPVLAAETEKRLDATLTVEDSYTVTIPKEIIIYPATDYRVGGELMGTAEGGVSTITAVTNTMPGYKVCVRVKTDSFNGAGTGISLINKTDAAKVVTTTLSVRDNETDEFKAVSKTENTVAEFYGLTGASNGQITGGSLRFSAPNEAQQSGNYSGSVTFELSYEQE